MENDADAIEQRAKDLLWSSLTDEQRTSIRLYATWKPLLDSFAPIVNAITAAFKTQEGS